MPFGALPLEGPRRGLAPSAWPRPPVQTDAVFATASQRVIAAGSHGRTFLQRLQR